MNFKKELDNKVEITNKYLEEFLPQPQGYAKVIYDAMRYSSFAGGKRLRPVLMMSAFEAVGGVGEIIYPFACALEMIHTYSLIHDDLPAMDNDDYRRGKLTNHKVYGEGLAILAGDALLNLAFEIMIKAAKKHKSWEAIDAIDIIASSAGVKGMIGGQVVDLISENKNIDEDILHYIHENKTTAIIQAALKAGAILGQGSNEEIKALERFGYCLGMAFQVQDDILDVISTQEELGKPIKSDERNGKATFVSLKGLESSKEYVKLLSQDAAHQLEIFKEKGQFLFWLSEYLMSRTY
ncbi:MAG: geranylgeranyl diphosphate synthase, type [Epulopiscium sp.]|jgi:geranylgeranyl diphosphate synthase type II|uniref:polyprenyl synthetase family protein n=1 Tax=Defluviitalea raffinosedens TaxID=1450156 RepID=UPI001772DB4D|nr:farnesyl diphosphate synthase [Defluviitalea raffinosedens]MBM7685525.1 geranylgeranyl diphosphate synthase type II [Defluviitalea raffinosedens]MBZ4668543.1 polyprenyl synthetase family protein [Defluviitaleaceae bacterium]MDK2788691.1 geranylgeranyl diphosphate synthase, type [Candidatus Epulonipiscium sp.]HHW66746.1 polyprenyl synthetase family protein [Candidatus Epulonipiscium sp.]